MVSKNDVLFLVSTNAVAREYTRVWNQKQKGWFLTLPLSSDLSIRPGAFLLVCAEGGKRDVKDLGLSICVSPHALHLQYITTHSMHSRIISAIRARYQTGARLNIMAWFVICHFKVVVQFITSQYSRFVSNRQQKSHKYRIPSPLAPPFVRLGYGCDIRESASDHPGVFSFFFWSAWTYIPPEVQYPGEREMLTCLYSRQSREWTYSLQAYNHIQHVQHNNAEKRRHKRTTRLLRTNMNCKPILWDSFMGLGKERIIRKVE